MVFDMGGGTLDLSILRINAGRMEVIATGGDVHLGGEDMTRALMNVVYRKATADANADVTTATPQVAAAMYRECERAKIALTQSDRVTVDVPVASGRQASVSITRRMFEKACQRVLARCDDCVGEVLAEAGVDAADIQEVVVVGGASKTPVVRQRLSAMFGGKVSGGIAITFAGVRASHGWCGGRNCAPS